MRRSAARVILIISLLITGLAVAETIEDAVKAKDLGDYKTAYRLFKPMAEQGNADAQFELGLMHFNGHGVPQDWEESAKWHRKAADQGHAPGQFALGQMYEAGHGVPQDWDKAVKWQSKAAEQGYAFAQFALGEMYEAGHGVPKDYVLADMWFSLAVSRYSASYKSYRYIAAIKINDVEKNMTPAQIAEAQKLAREWKPKKEK